VKWYFAITAETLTADEDHGFKDCIYVAVRSALKNTTLRPHLLYDGAHDEFTKGMESLGVTVIRHRLSFFDRLQIAQREQMPEWPHYMRTAAGAFLRLDIPRVEFEDDFVLYTDCDVMFTNSIDLNFCRPEIFAVAGQFEKKSYYSDMNSGVMLINVQRIRRDLPALVDFLCNNFYDVHGYDQELLRLFYNARWDPLSACYNWKPYWGGSDKANIVHFHGPKPAAARKLIDDHGYRIDDPVFHTWRHWFFQNVPGYEHYVPLWEDFRKTDRPVE
jgi:lipopolysaccharide biosynthesis glycosyltransferase